MTPRDLARKVVETKRYTGWQVWADGKKIAFLPASAAGHTEDEALAKARHLLPGREVTVKGVRCA